MDPKQQICDIGKRIYERGFVAANDGNISCRVGENEILCTPTMQSKGFMQPDDICTIDLDGKQIAGAKKRSSEVLLHLEVYRHRADVKSVVHCHPPHATAFAIAREPIPQCVLPEVEIFLGEVPIAEYATPGSQSFAESIAPFVKDSNVIVLANHGTVSFGGNLEMALWFSEILDAYCRILILARQLGGINYIDIAKAQELLDYKQQWGFSDLRIYGDKAGCNICGHESFRSFWDQAGITQTAFPAHPDSKSDFENPTEYHLDKTQLEQLADLVADKLASKLKHD